MRILVAAALAAARPRPGRGRSAARPTSASPSPPPARAQVAAGAQLTSPGRSRTAARKAAGKSTTELVLSTDAKLDKQGHPARLDRREGGQGPARRPRTRSRRTCPASVAPRRYTLLVCADAQSKVAESSEKNNCRAARRSRSPPPRRRRVRRRRPARTRAADGRTALRADATPSATPPPALQTTITEAPADVEPGPGRPLRVHRQPGRLDLRVPARRRRLRGLRVAEDLLRRPRRLPRLRGPRGAARRRARGDRGPPLVADRVRGARRPARRRPPRPRPRRAPRRPPTGEMTLVGDTTEFLYTGADPIQKQVGDGRDRARPRVGAARRVMRRNGTPIDGVRVTVVDHPELGRTPRAPTAASRSPSTAAAPSRSRSSARATSRRSAQLEVPTQEFERVEEIVLVPYDDQVTGVDLAGGPGRAAGRPGRARSPTATARARRRCCSSRAPTPPRRCPTAPTKALGDRLNIRATEFTIGASGPAAMPGELPPTSAYTYAVEYSVDEASKQQAVDVKFDKPVVTYVDNYLKFPAGTAVPMGYYDREKAQWIPAPNGDRDRDRRRGRRARTARRRRRRRGRHGRQADRARDRRRRAGEARRALRPRHEPVARGDHPLHAVGLQLALRPARRRRRPRPGRPGRRRPATATTPAARAARSSSARTRSSASRPRSPARRTSLVYQSDRVPGRRTGDSLEIPLTGANAAGARSARVELDDRGRRAGRSRRRSRAPPNLD